MARSGTYTYTEARPAGDTNQNWAAVACAGEYVIVAYSSTYVEVSADRGVTWTKERPNTSGSYAIYSTATNVYGQMMVGHYGSVYSKRAGTWTSELTGSFAWYANISPDGSRMIAGAKNGRLWSWYDGTWTEERPAGDANKAWQAVSITDAGDMLAGIYGARLYKKPAGGSWAEIQPDGAVNKNWTWAKFSADGTKHIVCCASSPVAWIYTGSAYTQVLPQPVYPIEAISLIACDCDAACSKFVLSRDGYSIFSNAAMNEYSATHSIPGATGTISSSADAFGAISPDASLMVAVYYGGRIWVYEKDTLPTQAAGGYYKEFTYTRSAGTQTNYKVRLKIYNKYPDATYLHCEGRANGDFSDIYFKNAAGDTLRHCLVKDEQSANSLTTGYYRYVWVELDEVGASPLTFRMYYGDTEHADSATAPTSFFDKFDDFERGANGDAVGGDWTVTAGAVKIDTARPWMGTRTGNFTGNATPGAATIPATAGNETYIGFNLYCQQTAGLSAQHGDGNTYSQWRWLGTDSYAIKNYTGGAWSAALTTSGYTMWKKFEMYRFDWAADTYDLIYNGSVIGDNLAMQASAGSTNILTLAQLGTSTSHYSYVDMLVICANCNPLATPDASSIGAETAIVSGPSGVKTLGPTATASVKAYGPTAWGSVKALA